MLAPDGRCKTLDRAADGYVRSEACEMLALSSARTVALGSLTLARAAPLAYVRVHATAVNQVPDPTARVQSCTKRATNIMFGRS